MYPRFTMIGQSLGSVYLSWEALCKYTPLYYIDTSGYAFTYPVARLFGCKVICYTHYPTISLDMISRVQDQNSMYNNDALIAKRFVFYLLYCAFLLRYFQVWSKFGSHGYGFMAMAVFELLRHGSFPVPSLHETQVEWFIGLLWLFLSPLVSLWFFPHWNLNAHGLTLTHISKEE